MVWAISFSDFINTAATYRQQAALSTPAGYPRPADVTCVKLESLTHWSVNGQSVCNCMSAMDRSSATRHSIWPSHVNTLPKHLSTKFTQKTWIGVSCQFAQQSTRATTMTADRWLLTMVLFSCHVPPITHLLFEVIVRPCAFTVIHADCWVSKLKTVVMNSVNVNFVT